MNEPLMTAEELAEFLSVPIKTIYQWRSKRCGPTGIRVGRYVRFRRRDVDAWLDEQSKAVA